MCHAGGRRAPWTSARTSSARHDERSRPRWNASTTPHAQAKPDRRRAESPRLAGAGALGASLCPTSSGALRGFCAPAFGAAPHVSRCRARVGRELSDSLPRQTTARNTLHTTRRVVCCYTHAFPVTIPREMQIGSKPCCKSEPTFPNHASDPPNMLPGLMWCQHPRVSSDSPCGRDLLFSCRCDLIV